MLYYRDWYYSPNQWVFENRTNPTPLHLPLRYIDPQDFSSLIKKNNYLAKVKMYRSMSRKGCYQNQQVKQVSPELVID